MRKYLLLLPCVFGIPYTSCGQSGPETEQQSEETVRESAVTTISRGPVSMQVRVTPKQIQLADMAVLEIQVESHPEVEILPLEFPETFGKFRVTAEESPLPQSITGKRIQIFTYGLEPLESGALEVDSIPITFLDKRAEGDGQSHVLESDPVQIEVLSVLPEDLVNLNELRRAVGPKELPQDPLSWWIPAGIAAGILILGSAAIWLFKSKATSPTKVVLSPRERALAALQEFMQKDYVEQGQSKLFYVDLTQIVRVFIEESTDVHAPEQTTEEFLRATQTHPLFLPQQRLELKAFLEAADLVKFGGARPSPEALQTSLSTARSFVETFRTDSPSVEADREQAA